MAKCGIVGCTDKVVGGFQGTLDAGHFQNPTATIPDQRTLWCKDHESSLNRGLGKGHYLSKKELKEL
jgi:hypothetical protein